jgi:hypothetical protein
VTKVKRYSSREEEALELSISTRTKILSGNYKSVAVIRSCYTIAEILGLNEDLSWLSFELNGYSAEVPNYRIINLNSSFQTIPHFVKESIEQIIGLIKKKKTFVTLNYSRSSFNLEFQYERIIECVINRCLLFLNCVTSELQYGGAVEHLLEEIRRKTDSRLSNYGEAMLAEAQSLYTSLQSENPADWSKVGHSCRKMLEILADEIFPERSIPFVGKDGQSHNVKQDKYVNRLVCFVDQQTHGSERRLLIPEIQFFATYIDRLNEDLNSIEHNTSFEEKYHVNLAAIRTYLIISELIRLSDKKALPKSTKVDT